MSPRPSSRTFARTLACTLAPIVFATTLAACGSDGAASDGKEQAAAAAGAASGASGGPACASVDTTPVTLAVRDFIMKAEPTPQRYLNAYGTDSAVPDDGFKVMQDKGPTYFYNSDTTAQRKLREKLAIAGPYASLLVIYRGQTSTEGGRAVDVRLAGQYVGAANDGKKLPTKRYAVRCDSTGWKIASSAEEPAP